jgi:hypothetical protein
MRSAQTVEEFQPCQCGDRRNHRVPERPQAWVPRRFRIFVHPMGKPISASTNAGLSRTAGGEFGMSVDDVSPDWVVSSRRPEPGIAHGGAAGNSLHAGAPSTAPGSVMVPFLLRGPMLWMGVGQNEKPLPPVGRPDFRCREDPGRDAVAQVNEVANNVRRSAREVPGDVLEEAPLGLALADDVVSDVGPEVPGIGRSETLAEAGERLARIAAVNDVNASSPAPAVEGCEVSPDWSAVKESVRHPGAEDVAAGPLDLDVADRPVRRDCEGEPKVDTSDA